MDILQETFFRNAAGAALLSGVLCAYLGVYIHLKRIVFIGIALSEVAALGVAAGLFLGVWPEAVAAILTVLVSLLFWLPGRNTILTREALLGFTYCVAAAGAILLLAANPMAEAHGVDLVSGNLLYTFRRRPYVLACLAAAIFPVHLLLFRHILLVSFDPETAHTLGIPVRFYEFLIYLTLGLVIAMSMKTAGILFVFSSMVIPPMTGLALCRRVGGVFIVSLVALILAVAAGLLVSFSMDLPTGPAVICMQGVVFLVSVILRKAI